MNSATELASQIKDKKISATEALEQCLRNVDQNNDKLNAVIHLVDSAKDRATEIDRKISQGEDPGRLAGVPVLVKDMFCKKGTHTTAASKALANYKAPYSCTVVERLESQGAVIFGKTNQDEFAMGSSNENSIYGECRNPWDLKRVPGGSSGGAAAAVASGMAPISFGTDTGGSIRQPASFCGVVGFKPTYGRVSRHGIIAFASSLDQAGPLTQNVRDAALATEIVSGFCPFDMTSSQQNVPSWESDLASNLKGLKVGLPKEYFVDGLDSEIRNQIEDLVEKIKMAGAEIIDVSLPHTQYAVPIYYLIATSEASSNLARYDGVRFGYRSNFEDRPAADLEDFYSRTRGEAFGDEVKRRIMLGTFALTSGYYDEYYSKACKVRRLIKQDFDKAFESVDILLSPVTTSPAFRIGEKIDDPMQMYLNDIFTISANLAGIPGLSLPCGLSQSGLPIGVQLMAKAYDEQSLLNAALGIEELVNFKELPSVLR